MPTDYLISEDGHTILAEDGEPILTEESDGESEYTSGWEMLRHRRSDVVAAHQRRR